MRVAGDSIVGARIFPGDIAVVDRSLPAADGAIILGILDGDFTIKRFRKRGGTVWLEAANPAYRRIDVSEESRFEVWGVVRYTISTH